MEPHLSAKRPTRKRAAILLVALLGVALVAWFVTQAGLSAAMVKQQLDAFAQQLKAEGSKQGRSVEFTYGDVQVIGGFSNQYAVVEKPQILIKPESGAKGTPQAPNTMLITTPAFEIYPMSVDFSALRIVLPKPVQVASEEAPSVALLTLESEQPIAVNFAQAEVEGTPYDLYKHSLPPEVRLTYLSEHQAAGEEDETPNVVPVYETLLVTNDKADLELSMARDASGLGRVAVDIKNLSIMPSKLPEGAVTVGMVSGVWSKQKAAENQVAMRAQLTVDAITADPKLLAYAPITLAFEAQVHEPAAPAATANADAAATPKPVESSYQISKFDLTTKDATISAKADFKTPVGELMPVGSSTLRATNVPFILSELKAYQFLDAADEELAAAVISKVSGKPFEEVKDLDIAVTRAQGQSFTIGQSSFEELFAMILQNRLEKFSDGDIRILRNPQSNEPKPVIHDETRG